MKKICSFVLCVYFVMLLTSACTTKQTDTMINSKRRFAKYAEYIEPQNKKPEGVIDLSEGPKLRYDANFGPKNPDFDFKIKNPY